MVAKIGGDLIYSEDKIKKLINEFDYSKVTMRGFYEELLEIKTQIEELYDNKIFLLGLLTDDAPYFGWDGDELKNMRKISNEIDKRIFEIYAIVLCGIGERNQVEV